MDLHHHFTVPASMTETWDAFNDLDLIGGCLPGATVQSVDGDDFTGSVKVKLGPISLQYNGSGSYRERDHAARKVVIVANGKDKRGNGTASATISAQLAADGSGTAVDVSTDLSITGKPAQFGRGVIQDVSDKLIGQFVECIKAKLGGEDGAHAGSPALAAAEDPSPAVSATAPNPASSPAGIAESTPSFPKADPATPPVAADDLPESERPTPKAPSARDVPTGGPAHGARIAATGTARADGKPAPATEAPPATGEGFPPAIVEGVAPATVEAIRPAPARAVSPIGPEHAEINLLSTIGPVLLKRYAKPAAAALGLLGVLALLRQLVSRNRR
jgi:carbon monoxide dehydrogenase subunit G